MTELKPICATLHPNMKSPCDGAIFVYAKDDVDKFIAEQNETHAVHEKYLTDAFNIREQALQDRLKKAETGVVHSPYITPTFLNRKSPNAIPIYVDLVDGTTLPGTFVCLAQARPLVETIDDGLTRQVPQTTWTLSILSDTLGSLDVDARQIVRIATDPGHPTEVKSPYDVAIYVNNLIERYDNAR